MGLGRSLLAGIASGAFMGVLFLGLGAIALVLQPSVVERLAPSVPEKVGPVKVSPSTVALATVIGWAIVGAFLGLVYFFVARIFPGAGIGSPNVAYSVIVIVLDVVLILLTSLWTRRHVRVMIAIGFGFAAIFGWLLPWLAS